MTHGGVADGAELPWTGRCVDRLDEVLLEEVVDESARRKYAAEIVGGYVPAATLYKRISASDSLLSGYADASVDCLREVLARFLERLVGAILRKCGERRTNGFGQQRGLRLDLGRHLARRQRCLAYYGYFVC